MKKLVLVIGFLFYCIYPVPSFPYVVTPGTLSPTETLANLVAQSPLIISGTVTDLSSRYPDGYDTAPFNRPVILTDVIIIPNTIYKGTIHSETLRFVNLGGCIEKDNVCFSTDLWPTFKISEKVLLFLKIGPDGEWALSDPIYGKQPFLEESKGPLGVERSTFQSILNRRQK